MPSGAARRAFGLRPGERIGRYECVAPLAMGGMAEVYLARHRGAAGFEKLVVIKRVLPHLAVDAEFVDMFLKEARLAAALAHPNIAQVIDFGHDGSDYYMVLEYVQGHDLRAVIKAGVARHDALPLDVALGIACETATALHHAHEQVGADGSPLGIVHRDVSPSNVLIAQSGAVKVIDFGIARAIGVSRTTRAGVVKGKAGYMSPEQCRDEALDRRTDVFGLGIVLYEMTTGYRLFHATSDYAAINKITEGRYVRPTEAVEGYPAGLESIVLRCLALERDDRFPTCEALRAALEAFALERRLSLSAAGRGAFLDEILQPPSRPSFEALVEHEDDIGELPTVAYGQGGEEAVPAVTSSAAAASPGRRSSVMLVALTAGITGLGVWGVTRLGATEATEAPGAPAEAAPVAAPASVGPPEVERTTNPAASPPIDAPQDAPREPLPLGAAPGVSSGAEPPLETAPGAPPEQPPAPADALEATGDSADPPDVDIDAADARSPTPARPRRSGNKTRAAGPRTKTSPPQAPKSGRRSLLPPSMRE